MVICGAMCGMILLLVYISIDNRHSWVAIIGDLLGFFASIIDGLGFSFRIDWSLVYPFFCVLASLSLGLDTCSHLINVFLK